MMRALLLLSALITTPTMTLADTEAWRAPLVDDFEAQDFSPAGGLYYRDNAEQRAGTVEFQDKEVFAGKGALKLSIKPQCSTAEENCSERAEIWEKTELRVPYNQGIWYGFAVKFADPIPSGDHRYLIAQWKREIDPGADGDFSPFLALRMNNGKLFATVETNYIAPKKSKKGAQREHCSKQQTPVWYRPKTNQMRALVATQDGWNFADEPRFSECTKAITVIDRGNKLPSPASGWIQFAIFTKPDANGNGRIELFANNKWIVTVKGHIGHNDKGLGQNQYFKFGPYRAADTTDWALYYDNFRRSPKCEDVMDARYCPKP